LSRFVSRAYNSFLLDASGTGQVSSSVLYEKFRVLTHRKREGGHTMKFIKQLNPTDEIQPPISKPIPMIAKSRLPDDSDHLADLQDVARKLRVSKRYVQTLVRRKVIPVIRLGRRCTRFDLDHVMNAVKKFTINEVR
jgi:excisionase family DNA binding protein